MKSEAIRNNTSNISNVISWLFGIVAFGIGVINTFWGNDLGYGIFIIFLSLVYFPPLTVLLKKRTGLSISGIVKSLLFVFILWSALGVAELFDKIGLMMMDFR